MKKFLALLLGMLLTAALLLTGCAPAAQTEPEATEAPAAEETPAPADEQETAALFTPGTYTASVYGNNGYLDVQVVLDADKIVSVDVPNHAETRFLGDTAIERITKDIVDYQTLNVDSISGATITSGALKSAVTQCIKDAGGDPAALQAPVPAKGEKKAEVTEETADVIVVGAGGAGLSAAVTSAQGGRVRRRQGAPCFCVRKRGRERCGAGNRKTEKR